MDIQETDLVRWLERRVDELEQVCAETYQVVGVLADEAGRFDDDDVIKVLDNLSEQRLVHEDVIPFRSKK